MSGRRSHPDSDLTSDPSTSSPKTKRSRAFGAAESETREQTEEEVREDVGLETTEKLQSSSSTSEGSTTEEAPQVESPSIVATEIAEPTAGPSRRSEESPEPSTSEVDIDPATKSLGRRAMGRKTSGEGESSLIGEHAHYEELSLIGDGAYGTVYKAKDLTNGQVVALKKVRIPLTENGLPFSTLREIATLKQLDRFEHPHIVRLLDVCQGNYIQLPATDGRSERTDRGLTLWMVFEHVEHDLASYLASRSPSQMSPALVKQMSKEILLGVDFLHSHRIIHRDLKPQNLLVTREGRIKIADFGLAKTYDFEMRLTSVVVTLWYRAPEVLLGRPYATPVDLWSVGCILAELNRLETLFPGTSEGDQLDRIFQIIGTPSQQDWPENVSLSWTAFPYRRAKPLASLIPGLDEQGLDLIKNMLTFDPHIRLTAAQALRHQYFAPTES